MPGLRRRRAGRGWVYLDADGHRVTEPDTIARIGALVIPPAWRDVWICPVPTGHLQATGIDAAGRKQYLYHPAWRVRRDTEKFSRMGAFARALPGMREVVARDLARPDLDRRRSLACAARLLDIGFFRIGGEDYARLNDSYGLTTLLKRHVRISDGAAVFDYRAKGGLRRVFQVTDPDVRSVLATLKARRGGGPELLAFREGGRWIDVKSDDVNLYLRETLGGEFTAKDFRTWNATVLAAVSLAIIGPHATSQTARKRAVNRAVQDVAHHLGNTPTVARSSYIDPRVIDRFHSGWTIGGVLAQRDLAAEIHDPAVRARIEAAVLDLLDEADTPALEKVA
jgi:DNA topoisomerase IB